MNCGEVGDEREEGLEDAQLDVDALVYTVTHCRDDKGDSGLRDSLECNKTLEGAEGYCDDLRVLGRASHEDGSE